MTSLGRSIIVAVAFSTCLCITFAQDNDHATQKKKSAWKEFTFPAYGFAITLPQAPKETPVKNGTQYRLYWDSDADFVVSLYARSTSTDCSDWFAWAGKTFEHSFATRVTTIKEVPTIEGDWDRNTLQAGYQRDQCINARLYTIEAGWPKGKTKPAIVGRIVNSFRSFPVAPK